MANLSDLIAQSTSDNPQKLVNLGLAKEMIGADSGSSQLNIVDIELDTGSWQSDGLGVPFTEVRVLGSFAYNRDRGDFSYYLNNPQDLTPSNYIIDPKVDKFIKEDSFYPLSSCKLAYAKRSSYAHQDFGPLSQYHTNSKYSLVFTVLINSGIEI